jgi:DNA polymerase V
MKLTIPFYLHKAGAGFPSPATDYIEEDVDLNVHLIKNVPATFIIRVQGKSMTDVGIYNGDLLVIDGQFLTSGSKNIEDKIIIGDETEVFIWGVVTYVIHSTY